MSTSTKKTPKCLYCGSTEDLQVEHLVPRSRGGLKIDGNIFYACKTCNKSKTNRLPSEWRADLPVEVYELEQVALSLHVIVRPRIRRDLKKDVIGVRCTLEQKRFLETAAAREGLAVSGWILRVGILTAEKRIRDRL